MAGLVPAIHALPRSEKDVDAQDKPGHDGARGCVREDGCYFDATAVPSGRLASSACNVDSVE
ncbi:hypothetical protein SAMN04487925_102449 [Bradyrhizobium sp. cf659]|nr:hypothetical protein SAMN04487925_102449 [Bradyrhizobium sp. cf659]